MSFKRVFFYYWQQVRKYKLSFYLIILFYGVGVFCASVLQPFLYKNIVDIVASNTASAALLPALLHALLLIAVNALCFNVFYRTGDFIIVYFQANIIREIYNSTFEKLLNHSYSFFANTFAGGLVAKSKRFAKSFESIHDTLSMNMLNVVVHITGILVVLFLQVKIIALVFFVWVILYIIMTLMFIRVKIKYDLAKAQADSRVTGNFADAISNVINIKIFSAAPAETNLFKEITGDEYSKRLLSWRWSNWQIASQGIFMASLQVLTIYLMIQLWTKGLVSAGVLILTQSYMIGLFDRLWNLGRELTKLFESLTDAKEMVDILDKTPDILDVGNPEECQIINGEINFNNVGFEYIEGHSVFKNFNLKVKSGEKVGLVGHSGSGKSTITKILLRFADINEGEVLIDGQNIKKIKQDDLRSRISYVPQEAVLFHRHIRENIAYSNPQALEEEVIEAAKKAHAHEFISKLQHGYKTMVGERGVKLSGGERQRVAIARAMLKPAPILILDEATSSLDSISESYIQEAFEELMKGKTTIVIAHRLSTIQKMDRIIVLDAGKIVEEGTHKELLAKNGFYADLWNHQTGGFLEE